jgi:hypothetical protein
MLEMVIIPIQESLQLPKVAYIKSFDYRMQLFGSMAVLTPYIKTVL